MVLIVWTTRHEASVSSQIVWVTVHLADVVWIHWWVDALLEFPVPGWVWVRLLVTNGSRLVLADEGLLYGRGLAVDDRLITWSVTAVQFRVSQSHQQLVEPGVTEVTLESVQEVNISDLQIVTHSADENIGLLRSHVRPGCS